MASSEIMTSCLRPRSPHPGIRDFYLPFPQQLTPCVASQIRPVCLAPNIQNLLTENSHPLIIREGGAKGIHQHHAVYKLTMYLMV